MIGDMSIEMVGDMSIEMVGDMSIEMVGDMSIEMIEDMSIARAGGPSNPLFDESLVLDYVVVPLL